MSMELPDKPLLDLIHQSAQVCREAAFAMLGANLEFDETSILKIDELISKGWPSGLPTSMTMQVWGCFLGEAICQTLGARWILTESGLGVEIGQVVAHPLSKIEKRFTLGPSESVTHFFETFKGMCQQSRIP